MNVWYEKHYSEKLGRDMECKVYGDGGVPVSLGKEAVREAFSDMADRVVASLKTL